MSAADGWDTAMRLAVEKGRLMGLIDSLEHGWYSQDKMLVEYHKLTQQWEANESKREEDHRAILAQPE